jgi:hypothetical protein
MPYSTTSHRRKRGGFEVTFQEQRLRRLRYCLALFLIGLSVALAACGSSAGGRVTALGVARPARWIAAAHIHRVLDLTSPRRDGLTAVAAAGRLGLLRLGSAPKPFASGPAGYSNPGGEEPYIALSTPQRGFVSDTVYVLRLTNGPGVTAVDAQGHARRFANLPGKGLENGIAFDDTGHFGHRLLVTATAGSKTSLYAIDRGGAVTTVTRNAPKVEGGIVVAPATFGRFAGDLIAPDENSGRVYAIAPDGRSRVVVDSGLPHGGDIGVESEGVVPAHFGAGESALVADRMTPGNPHPGDDVVLRIGGAALAAAGVRLGDLLVATEGGARTDAIRCGSTCRVRHVADGPSGAHLEGHIVFVHGG